MNDELTRLPFDLYARYRDCAEAIGLLLPGPGRLSILDVGGGEPGLMPAMAFWGAQHSVTVVDQYDQPRAGYIQGTGTALDFEDESFDAVVSCSSVSH